MNNQNRVEARSCCGLLPCVLGSREKVEVNYFEFVASGIRPRPTLLLSYDDLCGFIPHQTASCTWVVR